jgi:hypothetical protein
MKMRPLHSITSSAIANNVAGMFRPNALAVFRLMTIPHPPPPAKPWPPSPSRGRQLRLNAVGVGQEGGGRCAPLTVVTLLQPLHNLRPARYLWCAPAPLHVLSVGGRVSDA